MDLWVYVFGLVPVAVVVLQFIWKSSETPNNQADYSCLGDVDISTAGLEKEIKLKLSRSLQSLPVHLDLPRLAKKFEILKGDSVLLKALEPEYMSSPVLSGEHEDRARMQRGQKIVLGQINEILCQLATHLDDDSTTEKIKSSFGNYFEELNIDVSKRLLDFLQSVVGEDTKTVRLLKACNQSVIAPAVYVLKSIIGAQFPYKDTRGGWRIFIMLQEDRVVVIHQRREQSYQADSFTFQWEFLMQFDLEVRQLLNASITVTDISFGKNDNEALQKGFRKTIRNYMGKTAVRSTA